MVFNILFCRELFVQRLAAVGRTHSIGPNSFPGLQYGTSGLASTDLNTLAQDALGVPAQDQRFGPAVQIELPDFFELEQLPVRLAKARVRAEQETFDGKPLDRVCNAKWRHS